MPGSDSILDHPPAGAAAGPNSTVPRFAGATRVFHWVNALPFIALLVTGLLLFVPEARSLHTGGYRLVPLLHVAVGIGLIAAIPLAVLATPGRRRLLHDLTRALTPARHDRDWLNWAALTLLGGRLPQPPTGKFNAGQKLNSLLWIILSVGLLASGAILAVNYFTKRVFDAAFVEQVFPWHTVLALLALPALLLHIYLAVVNRSTRPSLGGIITGRVNAAWAKQHHPNWQPDEQRDGGEAEASKR